MMDQSLNTSYSPQTAVAITDQTIVSLDPEGRLSVEDQYQALSKEAKIIGIIFNILAAVLILLLLGGLKP